MRRGRLLPRRRRDRPAARAAAERQARRPRGGLRRRGAAVRGSGARRSSRRRQRAGPPGRGNPGRRTRHHHGQRRRRVRRARRVRRGPGLPHRAGQRPGRRGRRDPVRRPGDLHRRPGVAVARAAAERGAHRPARTRRSRRRGDRPHDQFGRTGCGLPPGFPACRRGREPRCARRGDRPAHRRHAGRTGAVTEVRSAHRHGGCEGGRAGFAGGRGRTRLAGGHLPGRPLAAVPVPNPSEVVRRAVGTPSVAEAAALVEPGATLLAAKRASAHATVAVARAGRGGGWR